MPIPSDDKIFRECEVLSVIDDKAGLRIKVKLMPEDTNIKKIEDLPYCFPLLPKHFHINPKVGEMVLIITSVLGSSGRRWFIGPIISQQCLINHDSFKSAQSMLDRQKLLSPFPRPELNPENDGSYPDREDVALQGRQNADLILKDSEVRLRCGFKKEPNSRNPNRTLLFNKEDLSYIQMKYKRLKDHKGKDFGSSINIVADRINLLSHDSKTPFRLNDTKALITDEELVKILEKAHPLVYGDELIEFLKQLIEVIRTHTHPFSMDPPCFTTPQTEVLNTDLNEMLSNSIRIN